MEPKEKNFFKKVWTSIKDFEGYEEFAADRVTKAIKYILILTMFFVIIISFAYTYKFDLAIESVRDYINENVEKIKIEDGKLEVVSNGEIIVADENSILPVIIVDTSENPNKDEYMQKIKAYGTGILLLSDRMVIESKTLTSQEEVYYSNIFSFDIKDKEAFISLLDGRNLMYFNIVFFITMFIYLIVVYIVSNLVDAVILGALGYLFARIMKIRLKYKATFNIGIHAITLPLILNMIYIIVNIFTGFEIQYFQWMYTSISYIYVVVAILMIKTEIINQKIQLIRLKEIQNKAAKEENLDREEKEPKEENKGNDEKEKEKEDDKGETPEGSNA